MVADPQILTSLPLQQALDGSIEAHRLARECHRGRQRVYPSATYRPFDQLPADERQVLEDLGQLMVLILRPGVTPSPKYSELMFSLGNALSKMERSRGGTVVPFPSRSAS